MQQLCSVAHAAATSQIANNQMPSRPPGTFYVATCSHADQDAGKGTNADAMQQLPKQTHGKDDSVPTPNLSSNRSDTQEDKEPNLTDNIDEDHQAEPDVPSHFDAEGISDELDKTTEVAHTTLQALTKQSRSGNVCQICRIDLRCRCDAPNMCQSCHGMNSDAKNFTDNLARHEQHPDANNVPGMSNFTDNHSDANNVPGRSNIADSDEDDSDGDFTFACDDAASSHPSATQWAAMIKPITWPANSRGDRA